jgi:hypothetical protein
MPSIRIQYCCNGAVEIGFRDGEPRKGNGSAQDPAKVTDGVLRQNSSDLTD